ncbi:MAG: CPBP family intramembrane metalloprotease, partial [Bradyrhizobium sp.]|nr:CPBP family intramembrane metalloprotease [Bradyrhizobium sp.]
MDSLDPAAVTIEPVQPPPRIWKFWGTVLWGFVVFAAMFVGQIAVVVFFVLHGGGTE